MKTVSQTSSVLVGNDFKTDFLQGGIGFRDTGFTGGYVDDIATTESYVLPGNPTTLNLPLLPNGTGTTPVFIASTSTQDSGSGTGVSLFILQFLGTQFQKIDEVIALNGTTPVEIQTKFIYHFRVGFAIAAGSGRAAGALTSNIGTIYVGSGAFNTSTGFATNYMWNRPGDGFVSSGLYVVPRNTIAQLTSVKYNADRDVSVKFAVKARASRQSVWSVGAEDNVNTTIVIERSLTGGFLSPGGEIVVTGRKTQNVANISCNFVMTALEQNTEE